MKLASSLAFFAAAVSSVLADAECDATVLSSIAGLHGYEECAASTGVSLAGNGTLAEMSDELFAAFCADHECIELIEGIEETLTSDCEIGGVHLLADIIEPIESACAAATSTAGSIDTEADVEASDDDHDSHDEHEHEHASGSASGMATDEAVGSGAETSASAGASSSNSTTPAPSTSGAPATQLVASALLITGALGIAL